MMSLQEFVWWLLGDSVWYIPIPGFREWMGFA